MTSTFERFLRSFTDEELTTFAQERARVRPPYWNLLRTALRIESDRRGLRPDEVLPEEASDRPNSGETRSVSA